MEKQHVIEIAKALKAEYDRKAKDTLEKTIKSIDAQSACTMAVVASRYEAKADAIETLLERLGEPSQEEEE